MTPFAKPAGWWLCPNQPRCGHPAVLHDIGDYEDEAPRCCVPDCPCGQVPEAEPEPAPDASHDDRTLVTVRTRFADYLARSRARDTARDKALREVFAAALGDGDYPAGMSKPKQYQEPETATMTGTHDRGVLPSADPQHSDPQPVDPAEPARTQEQQQNPPAPPDTEINPEKDAARP